MKILAVNAGSSSFKFKRIDTADESVSAAGAVERIGALASEFRFTAGEQTAEGTLNAPDHLPAVRAAVQFLDDCGLLSLDGAGFKTVFAKGFTRSVLIDEKVEAGLEAYIPVMPLHNPAYLSCIRAVRSLAPGIPMAAVFETAFHETLPPHVRELGLPRRWTDTRGIRRYGFHGASHRWVSERAPQMMRENNLRCDPASLRLVSCHLGGSSSVCAVAGGRSVDISMSFSAQSGVLQGSRCGDLDPFIPLYLIGELGMSAEEVSRELMTNSGLAGVSGIQGGDMRDLLDAAGKGSEHAALALDAFHYGVKKTIGAYAAALGGLDALAFTGGIGQRSGAARKAVCGGLQFLGVHLDAERNRQLEGGGEGEEEVEGVISTPESAAVLVVAANEELVVARETARLIQENRRKANNER